MDNCKYCGTYYCSGGNGPKCEEAILGHYKDCEARKFKAGDFVDHPKYGFGQVAFVLPSQGLRITFDSQKTTEWYNPSEVTKNTTSHPAEDMYGRPIEIGDTVYYPLSKGGDGNGACIRTGIVKKIEEPSGRGYGYWTRKLKIEDSETKKTVTHNYPSNCIIIN